MAKIETAPTPANEAMIDVRQAVKAAHEHSSKFYKGGASLEETELTEDGRYWLITLSFLNPWTADPILSVSTKLLDRLAPHPLKFLEKKSEKPPLIYKVFKVDARTGRVVSMRIRPVE